jgi:hypothetical protein
MCHIHCLLSTEAGHTGFYLRALVTRVALHHVGMDPKRFASGSDFRLQVPLLYQHYIALNYRWMKNSKLKIIFRIVVVSWSRYCSSIPLTSWKLSPQQAMEAYRVVRCWGSHIVQTVCSQIAVRLSVLRTDRALLPRNNISLLLVLISVRAWVDFRA